MRRLAAGWWLGFVLLAAACQANTPPFSSETPASSGTRLLVTAAPLPTLYPTATGVANALPASPEPSAGSTPARAPAPTPVDLTRPVLFARLQIPAIGYDRALSGTVAGSLTIEDRTGGEKRVISNRGRSLAEITAALQSVSLEPLPDDCPTCTHFEFDLAAEGVRGQGWLRDSILLASLELFFSRELGPHFPPDTVLGLHRSPSGYTIGQTTAVLSDGTLWQWQAPDDRLPPAGQAPAGLPAEANRQPVRFWEDEYRASCPFYPDETLFVRTSTEVRRVRLKCPALALPTTMIPLYAALDRLSGPLLNDPRNLPFPPEALPLDALAAYQRPDGAWLVLYADGRASGRPAAGESSEESLTPNEIERLAERLTESGVLPRGVQVLFGARRGDYEEIVLARGRLGVYEFPWSDRVGQGLLPEIVELENLLFQLIGPPMPTPTPAGQLPAATASPAATPTP